MMNRAEHLAWSKERALQYVEMGDIPQASASMGSDLRKHPELADHGGLMLMMMELLAGTIKTPDQMRQCIEGFN